MIDYRGIVEVSRLPEKKKYYFETDDPICQAVYAPLEEGERVLTFETSTRLYVAATGKKVIGEVTLSLEAEKISRILTEMVKPIVQPIENLAQSALGPEGSVERLRNALGELSNSLQTRLDEIKTGIDKGDTQISEKLANFTTQIESLAKEIMRQRLIPKEKEVRELDVLDLLANSFLDDQFEPVGKIKEYDIEAKPAGLRHYIPIEIRDRQTIYPSDLRTALDKTDQPVHYYVNLGIPIIPSRYAAPQITIETIGGRYLVLCISEEPSFIQQGYKIAKVCLGLIEAGEAELVKEKIVEIQSCLEDLNIISRSIQTIKTRIRQIEEEAETIERRKESVQTKLESVLEAMQT